jgi:hypothetical protein
MESKGTRTRVQLPQRSLRVCEDEAGVHNTDSATAAELAAYAGLEAVAANMALIDTAAAASVASLAAAASSPRRAGRMGNPASASPVGCWND